MGSRRAIYNDIAPTGRIFFVRGYKIPEGTALPEGILLPRAKKNRPGGGYIVVYGPTRPHIYNKYPIFFYHLRGQKYALRGQKYALRGHIYALRGHIYTLRGHIYACEGIYTYICPVHRAYMYIYALYRGHIYAMI